MLSPANSNTRSLSLHRWLRLAVVVAGAVMGLASSGNLAQAAKHKRTHIEVTGTFVQPLKWVRSTLGRAPRVRRNQTAEQAGKIRRQWAKEGAKRLTAAYKKLGFAYCRVFWAVGSDGDPDDSADDSAEDRSQDHVIRFDVDEGKMSGVELVGSTDIVKHVLFPLDMSLPGGIFQKELVTEALGRLRVLHNLGPLSYRVLPAGWTENAFGQRVRNRLLQVTVNRRLVADVGDDDDVEVGGFGFKLVADLRWGATAVGTLGYRNLLLKGDRFSGRLEVGLPLSRLLFEEDPKLRWVYGQLKLRYDFPEIGDSNLHPSLSLSASLPFEARGDLGLARTLALRNRLTLGVIWRPVDDFYLWVSAGINYLKHMRVDLRKDWNGPVAETTDGLLRGEFAITFGFIERNYRRRDLRSRLYVGPRVLTDGDETVLSLSAIGQLTLEFGTVRDRHYLTFRTQAWTLHGDVAFWDERPLSGTVHRVYTHPFIWARHAAQLEIAWRFPVIGEEFQLGIFHGGSVFEDRTDDPVAGGRLAIGNAFGPSAHALLFNFLAIDLYYGFGFSTYGRFSHSMTFTISNVF